MKSFVVCLLIMCSLTANAQSIGLCLGHSLTPADHVSLRYEHWTNGAINLAGAAFYERSRANGLNYSCYGAGLLCEYASNRNGSLHPLLSWRGGMGVTVSQERDPWLYKNTPFSGRLNYGLVGEAAVECDLTEVFRISVFAEQKLLLRSALGTTHFVFGLGLSYALGN